MKPFNYYDFLEIFPLPGCAVCRLVARDVERFIDSHLYEYVNTPETHAAMRAARGFCAEHSRQLIDYGASVLGIAILHAAVLDELLKIAASLPRSASTLARWRGGSASLADRLEPDAPCLACEALTHAEGQHIRALVDHLRDPKLLEAYRASAGLCLPHFRQALRAAPNVTVADMLIDLQTAIWQKLKAELDTFADKYDINHADEAMGEEADSWRRAVQLIPGEGRVFGLRAR